MPLTVNIDTDNDAVQDPWDLAQLLTAIGRHLRQGRTEGTVRDLNGNTVGSWTWT